MLIVQILMISFFCDGITLSEISKDDLITAAFYGIDNIPVCNNAKAPVSLEVINKALKDKFNSPGLEITLEDLKNYSGSNLLFEFDDEIIYAWSNNCGGYGIGPMPYFIKHVESQELDGNNLYIYYRVSFYSYLEGDDDYIYGIYDVSDLETVIGRTDDEETVPWSKFSLYKSTYEIIDGEFYFRSNEKVEQ